MEIPLEDREFIASALREDLGTGDITSNLTIPEGQISFAELVAKQDFVLAGLPFAREAFILVDSGTEFEAMAEEGSEVKEGGKIAMLKGRTRSLLAAERVALNILQRLSGVATLTRRFVKAVEGLEAAILDTRKTTPCMRSMEKYAVRMGGGRNHRMGLYDRILIKDNHIEAAGGVGKAVALARAVRTLKAEIEVEAETLGQLTEALEAGANIIMLDNMSPEDVREAVAMARGKALLEVSGGITLDSVRAYAETGVDMISVGALTHSAPAVDISMEMA